MASEGGTDKDVIASLGKARGSFVKLKNLWKSNSSKRPKIKLYTVIAAYLCPNV